MRATIVNTGVLGRCFDLKTLPVELTSPFGTGCVLVTIVNSLFSSLTVMFCDSIMIGLFEPKCSNLSVDFGKYPHVAPINKGDM